MNTFSSLRDVDIFGLLLLLCGEHWRRRTMENGSEVNIVYLEMDRDAEASAESHSESSTLSNSLESVLTRNECGGVWTNEKHNSYLDSLENSFVRQLYSLLGREEETRRTSRTRHVQSNSHVSTDQFTVLQNGCRQKVNFGKKRAYLEMSSEYAIGTTDQGNVLCKEEIKNSGDKAFTRTAMRNSLGHEYPAQCTAEVSGQNFREEVEERGCNSGVSRKRRREANYDETSLNDQVVP
ncbi:hypothetical protein HID58_078634 [Brassica napus]|uniref:Uncharacterized protein n=2 Tax=Brassica TaxID=3705 RepID=A0A0D3DHK7_BRAOL|nr:PREDICTED: uncharacterized protein LOC106304664 [Brassica oleracea var. oleracea]XP_022562849.2 cold-regulated protein 28 [Brassica napus]KAH0871612.1 hypothetical protein HID58_078634 [Brassica napus]CAF2031898.1 unnamed protein product [Brassica napus]